MIPDNLQFIFPGGKLKTETIAATAGNVATSLRPPNNRRWLVLYGRITLVADANAANRQVQIHLTDGTNILAKYPSSASITANETKNVSFMQQVSEGGPIATTELDKNVIGIGPVLLEGDIVAANADRLVITIGNGLAGDSYTGFVRVLEVNV